MMAKRADELKDAREQSGTRVRAFRRGRVLVIDDHAPLGRAIARALRAEHDVTPMTDAREALDHLANGAAYDLVLCDMQMPGMHGAAFYSALAERVPHVLPRVVFLTGGPTSHRSEAVLAKARVLAKPFEIEDLRALVREYQDL
jgi:CheY-like chemotaxis protein